MRGFLFIFNLLLALGLAAPVVSGQEIRPSVKDGGINSEKDSLEDGRREHLDSAVVSASRAGRSTPVTYTMVGERELRSSNPLNSLPMMLALQPSIVSANEGGTGLGYSKFRVRGVSGSQTNVTLNGITLNDAESQEVFWVNIPALSSLLSSVQLQRGLGTSANGAGAFGASVNMSTASVGTEPYARFDYSMGAWNTSMTTVAAGTGLLPGGLYASAAYSKNSTDGYIRNAWAKVQSAFAVLGWMNGNNSLRFTWLMGNQHTGITWNGISASKMATDRTYNSAGEYYDELGNVRYYDNDSDNYTQNHLQLNYAHQFGENLIWSTTLNYTPGNGYYEEYKDDASFTDYGLKDCIRDGVTYSTSDMVRIKSMDNSLYVLNSSLTYSKNRLNSVANIYLSRYDGDHFGNIAWSSVLGDDYDYSTTEWYRNNGLKQEASASYRAEYQFTKALTGYADLQYRYVSLKMKGLDDEFSDLSYDTSWSFFNPRAGLSRALSDCSRIYGSAALGHREPGRSDIKDVIETINAGGSHEALKAEKMLDIELGYEFTSEKFSASADLYAMEYWDMLIETGKRSNVGYAIKENVPRAWRRGVELSAAWKPLTGLEISANAAFSDNRIKEFTAYLDAYDADWTSIGQTSTVYSRPQILLSPSAVGSLQARAELGEWLHCALCQNLTLSADWKYVGRQYWDNTSNADRCIPSYNVMNCSLQKNFSVQGGTLGIGLYVNNLLNAKYYADAWVYRAMVGGSEYQEEGLFPQAPRNALLKVTLSF
jgi:iron complex outermembrane recepter protein